MFSSVSYDMTQFLPGCYCSTFSNLYIFQHLFYLLFFFTVLSVNGDTNINIVYFKNILNSLLRNSSFQHSKSQFELKFWYSIFTPSVWTEINSVTSVMSKKDVSAVSPLSLCQGSPTQSKVNPSPAGFPSCYYGINHFMYVSLRTLSILYIFYI